MMTKGLCIVLTDRCNAACEICCFSCSPENNHVMDEALMFQAIDQATEVEGISYIGFSGGEPFLYYDLLKTGLAYARSKGFATSVATNGFWGNWPDEILQQRLGALQLDKIFLSTDYYHQQFVPGSSVERAISAARALGIGINVGIGETRSHTSGAHFQQMGDSKYLLAFYTYPYIRAGRAASYPESEFFQPSEVPVERCVANGLIAVLYDGKVFPCCKQQVFSSGLILGNLHESPLKEILSSSDTVALMRCLNNPRCLHKLLEEKGMTETYQSACDSCSSIFGDKKSLESLLPLIHAADSQIAAEQLLGR